MITTDWGAVVAYSLAMLMLGAVLGWFAAALCMVSKCCDCRDQAKAEVERTRRFWL